MNSSNQNTMPVNDAVMRASLKEWLMARHGGTGNTILIDELGINRGRARVDLVVVNGKIHGYEIKSDLDRLTRLEHQSAVYSKVLDRATLVVGNKHLEAGLQIIPSWWGVVQITGGADGLQRSWIRKGRQNPCRDPRVLGELLWREEMLELLQNRQASAGLLSKPRRYLLDRICELLSIAQIGEYVRRRLKARASLRVGHLPQ